MINPTIKKLFFFTLAVVLRVSAFIAIVALWIWWFFPITNPELIRPLVEGAVASALALSIVHFFDHWWLAFKDIRAKRKSFGN